MEIKQDLIRVEFGFGRRYLYVNDVLIGEQICGEHKKYESKETWAAFQVKKRLKVLNRNINRLQSEIEDLQKEKDTLIASIDLSIED
jgi:predicted transcriptional regulator